MDLLQTQINAQANLLFAALERKDKAMAELESADKEILEIRSFMAGLGYAMKSRKDEEEQGACEHND